MKRCLLVLLTVFSLFFSISAGMVFAQEPADTQPAATDELAASLELFLFFSPGCHYCANEKEFLRERVQPNYPEVLIHELDWQDNRALLDQMLEEYDVQLERQGVPMTFVAGEFFFGFGPSSDRDILRVIDRALGIEVGSRRAAWGNQPIEDISESETRLDRLVEVPFFGQVNVQGMALPLAAFVLGSVDGLNICSIGALILILTIVVVLNSRRAIFVYGGLFLITTALVYGVLVFAWFGLLRGLFSVIHVLEYIMAAAGLFGGIYFFRRFLQYRKYGPACEMQTNRLVSYFQEKLQRVLAVPGIGFFATASVLIAFSVVITVVELPCSIALPAIFSGMLADAGLGTLSSFLLILLYLFFYLLIEIVVFLAAVYTKKVWYGPDAAVVWVTLLASLVLLGIGAYYLSMVVPW